MTYKFSELISPEKLPVAPSITPLNLALPEESITKFFDVIAPVLKSIFMPSSANTSVSSGASQLLDSITDVFNKPPLIDVILLLAAVNSPVPLNVTRPLKLIADSGAVNVIDVTLFVPAPLSVPEKLEI